MARGISPRGATPISKLAVSIGVDLKFNEAQFKSFNQKLDLINRKMAQLKQNASRVASALNSVDTSKFKGVSRDLGDIEKASSRVTQPVKKTSQSMENLGSSIPGPARMRQLSEEVDRLARVTGLPIGFIRDIKRMEEATGVDEATAALATFNRRVRDMKRQELLLPEQIEEQVKRYEEGVKKMGVSNEQLKRSRREVSIQQMRWMGIDVFIMGFMSQMYASQLQSIRKQYMMTSGVLEDASLDIEDALGGLLEPIGDVIGGFQEMTTVPLLEWMEEGMQSGNALARVLATVGAVGFQATHAFLQMLSIMTQLFEFMIVRQVIMDKFGGTLQALPGPIRVFGEAITKMFKPRELKEDIVFATQTLDNFVGDVTASVRGRRFNVFNRLFGGGRRTTKMGVEFQLPRESRMTFLTRMFSKGGIRDMSKSMQDVSRNTERMTSGMMMLPALFSNIGRSLKILSVIALASAPLLLVFGDVFDDLFGSLEDIGDSLAPVTDSVGEFIAENKNMIFSALSATGALGGLYSIVTGNASIFNVLQTALGGAGTALGMLLDISERNNMTLDQLGATIAENVAGGFQSALQFISDFMGGIADFVSKLPFLGEAVGKLFGEFGEKLDITELKTAAETTGEITGEIATLLNYILEHFKELTPESQRFVASLIESIVPSETLNRWIESIRDNIVGSSNASMAMNMLLNMLENPAIELTKKLEIMSDLWNRMPESVRLVKDAIVGTTAKYMGLEDVRNLLTLIQSDFGSNIPSDIEATIKSVISFMSLVVESKNEVEEVANRYSPYMTDKLREVNSVLQSSNSMLVQVENAVKSVGDAIRDTMWNWARAFTEALREAEAELRALRALQSQPPFPILGSSDIRLLRGAGFTEYQEGGYTGIGRKPIPAILHPGEFVIPEDKIHRTGLGAVVSSTPIEINVSIGAVSNESDIERLKSELRELVRDAVSEAQYELSKTVSII